jgi:hypothetical protein
MPIARTSEISVVATTVDAATTARFYAGYNFRNSTGAAITVAVYDGTNTSGILIESVVVAANGSVSDMYPFLIPLTSGSIYVDWTTGIVGSLRVIV